MGKNCLVIIDMQRGFFNANTAKVMYPICQLADSRLFDTVVATVFKNSLDSNYVKFLGWQKMISKSEQRLPKKISVRCDYVFEKTGYTCFTDEFCNFISAEQISRLFFVGIDLDCCILKSACDCFELGIDFKVITDCCASKGGYVSEESAKIVLMRLIGERQMITSEVLYNGIGDDISA